jgi:polyisoprenoid-binding protein YceI
MKKYKLVPLVSALLMVSSSIYAATPSKSADKMAVAVKKPTAEKWTANLDQGTGETEFLALGRPSALKIVGKGAAPKGTIIFEAGKATGTARFSLASLDTGIGMRNEHMKTKYLEVEKFPEATLTLTKLEIPAEKLRGDFAPFDVPFEGKLSLHGVEKPVSGTSKVSLSGAKLTIEANFGLEISDYGIASPGYGGVTMAKEVKVSIKSSAPFTKTL